MDLLKMMSFALVLNPKLLVALLILIFETAYAQKPMRTINYCLMPLAFFGWTFIIMHWPFGYLLFCGSLFMMIALLLVNIFRKKERDAKDLLVLMFPVCRFLLMITVVFRMGSASFCISRIESLLAGIIAGVLFYTAENPFKKQG